jgi:multidrug efflux pump subunit AcrB
VRSNASERKRKKEDLWKYYRTQTQVMAQHRQADLSESISSLLGGFVLTILAIYAMLAVPFRSYVQPLIVMVAIPFGIVGAVIGHMIMGYSLSIMSMMGVVALSGVVVNDSLLLIDYANNLRHKNFELSAFDVKESSSKSGR